MDRQTRLVERATKQKFFLDDVQSVKRSASGDHWIVKVFKWHIGGTQAHLVSGIDKSKSITYKAVIDGNSVVFAKQPIT